MPSFPVLRLLAVVVLLSLSTSLSSAQSSNATAGPPAAGGDWPMWGGDYSNDKFASTQRTLTASNIGRLVELFRWSFNGSVGGLPVVVGPFVYFNVESSTSSLVGGHIVPIPSHSLVVCGNRLTGALVWQVDMTSEITFRNFLEAQKPDQTVNLPLVRGSPAVLGDYLWVASQSGAWVFKMNRFTGAIVLATRADYHPLAVITAAPVVYGSRVYVGISSSEELFAESHPTYITSFRGSVVALDTATMAIVARLYTIPAPDLPSTKPPSASGPGIATWSGGAVWGSSFVIDATRNVIYFGTGNQYTVPPAVEACRVKFLSAPQNVVGNPCRVKGDLSESVVAATLDTLEVVWVTSVGQVDSWTLACGGVGFPQQNWCSSRQPGGDFDFGQAPVLVRNVRFTALQTGHGAAQSADGLFIGQKSGALWAFRADTGALVWVKQIAPPGMGGGLQFGISADGDTVYASSSNSDQVHDSANDMNRPSGPAVSTTAGKFIAVRQVDGGVKWQVLDTNFLAPSSSNTNTAYGTTSVLPGVVIAPLTTADGTWHALNAASGLNLGTWRAGAPVSYGASIAEGQVLVATGAAFAAGPAGGQTNPAVVVYGLRT